MSKQMRKSESTKSHFSPAMSWKTRLTLYMGSAITDTAQRPDGTLNRRLLNVLDLKAHPNPHSVHHVKTSDVSIDPSRNLWFRVFTPTGTTTSSTLPLFVFFHGGGFAYLSPASKSYDAVCRRLARRIPAVVVSVNYRLSPEYRFPCQYSDGFDALRFLDGNSHGSVLPESADPARCFLGGDSAGANLAHHVAVMACRAGLRRVRVVGLVSIQPFFGGEERTEAETRLVGAPLVSMKRTDWLWRVFLPDGADRDHGAVNVSGPNAEDISGLEGFPETVVFVGGYDPLQDWQRRYGEWLRNSGKKADIIEYPNMIHAFYVFPELPEASQLIDQVKDFVNIRLSSLLYNDH